MSPRLLLTLSLLIWCWAELRSLGVPKLSGDEAIGAVTFVEMLREWSAGSGELKLNPIVSYLGPIDLWLFGTFAWVPNVFQSIEPHPWMVRLVPLALFFAGLTSLFRELHHAAPKLSWVTLGVMGAAPLAAIHARIGWGPALSLGISTLIWAELTRAERKREPRWTWLAVLAGVALEVHPTSALMLLAAVGWAAPSFLGTFHSSRGQIIRAAVVFGILAFPVLRNFPPPAVDEFERGKSMSAEVTALLDTIGGNQPWRFHLVKDPFPDAFAFSITIAFCAALVYRILRESSPRGTARGRWHLGSTLIGSVVLFGFCVRGRSLAMTGHERYLVGMIPAWAILTAETLLIAVRDLRVGWNLAAAGLALLTIANASRLHSGIRFLDNAPDPALQAARWIEKTCRPSECIVYAEDFWIYWPLRFYLRDRYDANVMKVNPYEPRWMDSFGRKRGERFSVGCWHQPSGLPIERTTAGETVVFEGPSGQSGILCRSRIEGKTLIPPEVAAQAARRKQPTH